MNYTCVLLERVVVVSEWHEDCLENYVMSAKYSTSSSLSRLAQQLLSALAYLEENGIVSRTLAPSNILITPEVSMHPGTCRLGCYRHLEDKIKCP